MQLINTLEYISTKEPSFDEEDSFYFLQDYQLQTDWCIYSSKHFPLDSVKKLANTFCYSHGMIPLKSQKDKEDIQDNLFWSSIPLGLFRYKMLENGSWCSTSILKKEKGSIVEGIYWINGFAYLVRNNDFILEANLFIDHKTKLRYTYPDTISE